MGMSTHVVGIRPPDAKWKQMKAVWDACQVAGVEPPDEVAEFFDHSPPDPSGIEVSLERNPCVQMFSDDMRQGVRCGHRQAPQECESHSVLQQLLTDLGDQ